MAIPLLRNSVTAGFFLAAQNAIGVLVNKQIVMRYF